MSFQAMTWAVSQECGSAATKLVLLMLANHANGHTGQCNPRHKTLAEECEMRPETLKDHLRKLAERGLISIVPAYMDGVQLPNHYHLNLHGGGGDFRTGGGGEKRMGGGGDFRPPYNQEDNQEDNRNTPQPPKGGGSRFEEFWECWPQSVRKVGKKACADKWGRKGFDVIADDILAHLKTIKTSDQWTRGFDPAPMTYLNQERWRDGIAEDSDVSALREMFGRAA